MRCCCCCVTLCQFSCKSLESSYDEQLSTLLLSLPLPLPLGSSTLAEEPQRCNCSLSLIGDT